jgi:hypothetical protein
MKRKKSISILGLLFFLFSCTHQDAEVAYYHISGTVYNNYNIGIPNIKVFYTNNAYVVTNAQGKFEINNINGAVSISPQDAYYTFTPNAKTVTTATSGLSFYGAPVITETANSIAVYNWFNQNQLPNGLVPSTENGTMVSLYDNALAALVFIAKGDKAKAESIFNFFNNHISSELNAGTGGFSQFRDVNGTPSGTKWMGDNCWLLIALNNYAAKFNSATYSNLQNNLASWIRSLQNVDGSLNGGYDSNGLINIQVTEGMIDAYNAISGYDTFHSKLLHFFKQNRWATSNKYLIAYPNNYYQYALDNFSWGYCAFEDFPVATLSSSYTLFETTKMATATNTNVAGFCFDIDKDDVWYEGTGEMVVAYQKAGMVAEANYYLAEMEKGLVNSTVHANAKGIPYATNRATGYMSDLLWTGADTNPVLSSSAWYLFGVLHFDPMALGYAKNCPQSDKFWLN